MSPTHLHKYKSFHSTVQRAKDRRQKFHFCRLPFDVRPRNVKLNLSIMTGCSLPTYDRIPNSCFPSTLPLTERAKCLTATVLLLGPLSGHFCLRLHNLLVASTTLYKMLQDVITSLEKLQALRTARP